MTIEVNENYRRPSPLKVTKKEKGKDYRWVSANEARFSMRRAEGWKPEKADGDSEAKYAYRGDGYIRHGDLILCSRSQELADKRKKIARMKAKQQLEAIQTEDTSKGIK